MSNEQGAASPGETRADITRLSRRGYTQLRHVFVQLPDRDAPRASVLAKMVHNRQHRALLLYIMLLTAWPWLEDRREPLQSKVWIRALTASSIKNAPTWSASTLSRCWQDLEELGLIERSREERLVRITPRREDAAGPYEVPGGRRDRWNAYFALPDEFWTDELFAKLSLPALAMLLVIAKETNRSKEMWLTYEFAEDWYGIKPKSAQKGLGELEKLGVLNRRVESIIAPLSPTGKTTRSWYSLTGPYSHEARSKLQKKAMKQTRKRLQTADAASRPDAEARP
ncbi:hypothetical protein [Pseudoclavibacter helvolus]|uniref:hypothetical protein n=1 Tax=Pseudoclavibacter helvolus TaxID=255205 RepID=UPI000838F4EF|nr:hypothetical protein [Pseudoclavibacter helvolus]